MLEKKRQALRESKGQMEETEEDCERVRLGCRIVLGLLCTTLELPWSFGRDKEASDGDRGWRRSSIPALLPNKNSKGGGDSH